MADLTFVPFEFPQSDDGKYTALVTEDSILKIRRDQLGLSQQNVADMTQIPLTQYQRLESGDNVLAGASMRIGLAVCAALLLDPYDFINVNVSQPDPNDMKPVPMFHTDLPDDLLAPKKTGRKTTWKDIKTVFINYDALRHMFATSCVKLGFDIKTLSEILGHSGVEITLNRYVHSSFEQKTEYMDRLKVAI